MPWLVLGASVSLAAVIHRGLQVAAPSNRLISRLRARPPRIAVAGALLALACALVSVAAILSELAVRGGPGWLHLVVLVAIWDAMKFVGLAASVVLRRGLVGLCRTPHVLVQAVSAREVQGPNVTRRCMRSVGW